MASVGYEGGSVSTQEILVLGGVIAVALYYASKEVDSAADHVADNPLTQGAGATLGLPATIWDDVWGWTTGEVDQFEDWAGSYL